MSVTGRERGGFVLGMVVGLLIGLSLALGVALYITKAPIPFVNKVPPRTAEQDQAEAERNRNWDPNAPLAGRMPVRPGPSPAASAPSPTTSASAPSPRSSRDPGSILAGANPTGATGATAQTPPPRSTATGLDPFVYFVQVGAYANADEAEQQRARLVLAGHSAKITEREQAGRTVYRVRLGPYEKREDAEAAQGRLAEGGTEGRLVRVERS